MDFVLYQLKNFAMNSLEAKLKSIRGLEASKILGAFI
jgi:hypothetical protein